MRKNRHTEQIIQLTHKNYMLNTDIGDVIKRAQRLVSWNASLTKELRGNTLTIEKAIELNSILLEYRQELEHMRLRMDWMDIRLNDTFKMK